ncbi:MAG TPA: hypothetical protein ENO23_08650 [Alphaproteobacteria bacterium]|nr:hypothetical protein [Alphaproteobacteria bacterium]
MARLIGKLVPEDDYMHPLGEEPNFNESMYFNFFDAEQSIGGFVRLGNRANEGRAEMTVCVYLPDGRVLFNFQRAPIDHNDAFDAGGMKFEVVEPTEHLRTTYRGKVIELQDPRHLADPSTAFRESPRRELVLDLDHRAAGPMYGGAKDRDEDERPAEEQFAKAHYEQHMAVTGTIEIDGQKTPISGFGLRDHSWGPRHWQAIHGYEWLTMNFGPDFGAMISVIRRDDGGDARRGGVLVRDGELDLVTDVDIETEYEANGLYHKALRVSLTTQSGERLRIDGDVKGFIPLRNRREGQVTHIGEGMTEWRCGDRVGYGLSEMLRQVE